MERGRCGGTGRGGGSGGVSATDLIGMADPFGDLGPEFGASFNSSSARSGRRAGGDWGNRERRARREERSRGGEGANLTLEPAETSPGVRPLSAAAHCTVIAMQALLAVLCTR